MRYGPLGLCLMVSLGSASACVPNTSPHTRAARHAPVTHRIAWTAPAEGARRYRFGFVPSVLTVSAGDSVRFEVASGWPHSVAFATDGMPANATGRVRGEMERLHPRTGSQLASPFFRIVGDGFTLSTNGWPPGRYRIHCSAHAALEEVGHLEIVERLR